jgi:hypothetical protein
MDLIRTWKRIGGEADRSLRGLSDGHGGRKRGGAAPAALKPDKASSIATRGNVRTRRDRAAWRQSLKRHREPDSTAIAWNRAGRRGGDVDGNQQIDNLRGMFQCDDVR